ncbi:Proteophosphoglycan ppg4 [Rhodotorula toruloides]|uniref:Proteophosphoglycan ppg4 n=1 Tax=Rhodotorula toruloides TaxID=5286 RepID=A0A2T0AJC5_RHOTO|nr:Proteophosphoglycan ppg4 [Rhodotorula toruloides]
MPATLPEDVLDTIFRYIEEDPYQTGPSGEKLGAARQCFYRLCLVSRAFCHLSRRFLYRRPLSDGRFVPQALIQLAETLRGNQRYLGKLVVDLSGAHIAYENLCLTEKPLGPISFQFRGFSKAFSWQLCIVSSCPNCREISAGYITETELKKLVRVISTSLLDLAASTLPTPAMNKFLFQLSALNLQKLSIAETWLPLSSFFLFFPVDPSRLTDVDLCFSTASESDLLRLPTLARQLVKLHLQSASLDITNYAIWDYAVDVEGLRVPTAFFALLPNIVHLELGGLVALSVQRLRVLAQHSPSLKHLSACHSLDTLLKPIENAFEQMRAKLVFEFAEDMAATLPQDVLDIIFGFLEEEADTRAIPQHLDVWLDIGTERTDARRHWLRLCLVCRSFLHAARRFLYKKPFAAANGRPARLLHLAETLRANHRYIGKLVVDLSGAAECYELLEEKEESLGPVSFQFRGFTKAFSWVVTLLSTCTNCRFASAAFSSQVELKKVLKTMAASLPDLQGLELRGFGFVADNNLLSPSSLTTLTVFKDLAELHLVGIPHGQYSTSHTVPQLPLQPRKLVMCERSLILECSLQYFPVDGSALREVDLSFGGEYDSASLIKIVRHTPLLVKLRLRGPDLPPRPVSAQFSERSKVPLEVFGALPHLVHLELRSFAAFSTDRLRLLAATSPKLKNLSGVTSLWITDYGFTGTFDGNKVAEVFKQFKQLESAHIGYLPRTSADVVEPIQRVFDELGAQLVYDRAPSYFLLV